MGANERLTIVARLQGANQIAREAYKAAQSIRATGKAAKDLDKELDHVQKRTFLFNQAMFTARRVLYGLTVGAGAAGTALAALGIKFNATMEQGQVGMEFMLGSASQASDEMAALLKLSRETIFDLPHITEAGRRLLGMGFDAQKTNEYIMAMSENMAVMGQPADTMDRIITAFGQIRSRGKLAGQEMLQLVNAQVPVYEILREELKLTGSELANISDTGIDAATALDALARGMTRKFGGANAAMLNTVNGQWQKFKENTQIIMGAVMMAPFTAIQQNFPTLLKVMDDMTEAMRNEGFYAMIAALDEGANASGRITEAFRVLHTFAQQLTGFFRTGLGPALLDTAKVMLFFLKYLLLIVGTTLAFMSHIPGLKFLLTALILLWTAHKTALMLNWFWTRKNTFAIMQSYKWILKQVAALKAWAFADKLLVGRNMYTGSIHGVTTRVFKQNGAVARLTRSIFLLVAKMKTAVFWTNAWGKALIFFRFQIYKIPIIGWLLAIIAGLILLEAKWHLVSRAIMGTFRAIRKLFGYIGEHKDLLLLGIPGIGPLLYGGKKLLGAFAAGGTAGRTGPYMVGERGPEIVNLPARTTVSPITTNLAGAGGMSVVVQPQSIVLDGRTIAEVVWKHKLDRFARR